MRMQPDEIACPIVRELDPVPDEDLNDGGANPSSSWIVDDDGKRR
jgi:hypothetical protein